MNDQTKMTSDVVLRFRSGETVRRTGVVEIDPEARIVQIDSQVDGVDEFPFSALKAVFFPRASAENLELFSPEGGIELAVEFDDGEVIRGRASGYNPASAGFFLYPIDQTNNERVFVVTSAIVSIDVERL